MLITQACKSLNAVCEAKQSNQLEMQRLAAMRPEYEVVMQMEGAGPITGPALMVEIVMFGGSKTRKSWWPLLALTHRRSSLVHLNPSHTIFLNEAHRI